MDSFLCLFQQYVGVIIRRKRIWNIINVIVIAAFTVAITFCFSE